MFTALFIFGIIVVVVKLVAEGCQKPYDPNDIKNIGLYTRDTYDPKISPKQMDRNIRSGKYR